MPNYNANALRKNEIRKTLGEMFFSLEKACQDQGLEIINFTFFSWLTAETYIS